VKQILYIVGAGLTKSLETSSAQVPLMADFVSVMSRHIEDPVIAQMLAQYEQRGAFEWPSTDVSTALAERVIAGDTSALSGFAQALRDRPGENIETMLESAISRDRKTAEDFKRAINRVFCRVHTTLNLGLLRRFITHQDRTPNAKHRVISFNYDISVDVALQEVGLWHPATGYGFKVGYFSSSRIEAAREEEARGEMPHVWSRNYEHDPESRWLLLKPHGSLNWVWVFNRMSPTYGLSVVVNDNGTATYAGDTEIPGSIWAGPLGGVPFDIAIAPPGAKNLFTYSPAGHVRGDPRGVALAEHQHQAIREADQVFVIGWSVPKTDAYHEALVRVCCEERRAPVDRAVIVNYHAPIDYFAKVRSLLNHPTTIETYNEGFANFLGCLGA
jgi:hypothetical protein